MKGSRGLSINYGTDEPGHLTKLLADYDYLKRVLSKSDTLEEEVKIYFSFL